MPEPRSEFANAGDSSAAFAEEFLRISRRQLQERFQRIESCVGRLTPEQIWSREHEAENAVGNLILHLSGNVRQWIVAGIGGVADQRDRDAEFSRREPLPADQVVTRLRGALKEADAVLASLHSGDLLAKRKIQVYEVTVLHAILHVVEHFAEHTGQIIWATKRMTGEDLGFYGYLRKGHASGDPGSRQP